MKDKIFYVCVTAILMMACSLDDVLKSSDDVRVIVMESTDTVRPLPGDTISFKLLASVNTGSLSRVEIIDKTYDFSVVAEDAEFAMVDTSLSLSLDSEGYFSRPVSTVMVMYPLIVPNEYDMVGKILGMTFRVSSKSGQSGTVSSCFKVSNCKTEDRWITFRSLSGYSCQRHSMVAGLSNVVKNQKTIELIAYVDASSKKYYYLSPDSQKARELMSEQKWDSDSIRSSRMVKLSKTFKQINDNDLDALNFDQGVDMMEITDKDVIGYVTDEGRRCVVSVNASNLASPSMVTKHTFKVKADYEKEQAEKKNKK